MIGSVVDELADAVWAFAALTAAVEGGLVAALHGGATAEARSIEYAGPVSRCPAIAAVRRSCDGR